MDNLLSIITFIPAVAALIMALFLRGDDKAAETNAKAADKLRAANVQVQTHEIVGEVVSLHDTLKWR